jgi:hypothetical protein
MASVKELKKDIDLILSMVLSDCFYVLSQNQKVNEEAVTEIASGVIKKHRELRVRTNHPDGKDNPKLVKIYYKQIVSELLSSADEALEKLSAEVKKTV